MKHYILWFRSGSIEGDIDDQSAEKLLDQVQNRSEEMYRLKDTDGELVVDLSNVLAVAANNIDEPKSVPGFTTD